MSWLENAWYNKGKLNYVLAPLALLFWCLSSVRRLMYKCGMTKQYRSKLPVIVVGNITVGGTGKTPFVIYLVALLRSQGFTPAIVSRGYGAKSDKQQPFPRLVTPQTPVALAGDEPKLLALRSGCPVVIDANRSDAISYVETHTDCDVIISDDGLQHYAMARALEIVLLDKARGFGNGWLLPVGPLRELPSRLAKVDLVVENHGFVDKNHINGDTDYCLAASKAYKIIAAENQLPLGASVHLISGIGNPQRFLATVSGVGYQVASVNWLPDHHNFSLADFARYQSDDLVLMTEKDAVKCQALLAQCDDPDSQKAMNNWYVLPIDALISDKVEAQLQTLLKPYSTHLTSTTKSDLSHGI